MIAAAMAAAGALLLVSCKMKPAAVFVLGGSLLGWAAILGAVSWYLA